MAEKTGKDLVEVFEEALNNIMPVLEVKARRIGGALLSGSIELDRIEDKHLHFVGLPCFTRKRREDDAGDLQR